MHPLSFLNKRAHLSGVARGREMFAGIRAMTPARFDILFLVHEAGPRTPTSSWGRITVAEVTARLGLARQTVWEMVDRLVELGLVRKWRDPYFHKQKNFLELTELGVERTRQAMGAAFVETLPLPPEAPAEGPVPRYFKELARRQERENREIEREAAAMDRFYNQEPLPKEKPVTQGREVAKIFTSWAWRRAGGGRRGRRVRQLEMLDRMIEDARDLARSLGNRSELIYELAYSYTCDH